MLQFPLYEPFRLTSKFGARKDPISGSWSGHNGVDLATPVGTPVHSPQRGTVITSFTNDLGGNQIIIEHPGGFKTGYAHLSKKVASGTRVNKGDIVAYTGNTGRSTGPHLHLTVKKSGNLVDPLSVSWQLKPGTQLTGATKIKTSRRGLLLAGSALLLMAGGAYYYYNYIKK